MTTLQGDLLNDLSVVTQAGFGYKNNPFTQVWHRLFDDKRIPSGTFNERLLQYFKLRFPDETINDLPGGMARWAQEYGSLGLVGPGDQPGKGGIWCPMYGSILHHGWHQGKHFFNGKIVETTDPDFTSYSLGTGWSVTATGLSGNGDATAINVQAAPTNLTYPFALVASWTQDLHGSDRFACSYGVGTTDYVRIGSTSAGATVAAVVSSSSTVASLTGDSFTLGERTTVAIHLENNNCFFSKNGATVGTLDTSCTMPPINASTRVITGERHGNAGGMDGLIHHIVAVAGQHTQDELNDLCAHVHSMALL